MNTSKIHMFKMLSICENQRIAQKNALYGELPKNVFDKIWLWSDKNVDKDKDF